MPGAGCRALGAGCRVVGAGCGVPGAGCPKLAEELASRGYETIATPLDEFIKAGGSAKCLTLRLDGEEAATWKVTPN